MKKTFTILISSLLAVFLLASVVQPVGAWFWSKKSTVVVTVKLPQKNMLGAYSCKSATLGTITGESIKNYSLGNTCKITFKNVDNSTSQKLKVVTKSLGKTISLSNWIAIGKAPLVGNTLYVEASFR